MTILIVEETNNAKAIRNIVLNAITKKKISIFIEKTILGAECFIKENPIDLLLIDLSFGVNDSFELLKLNKERIFQTIVLSENPYYAFEAFQYNVLDFVRKPICKERLLLAIERYETRDFSRKIKLNQIPVKKENSIILIHLSEIDYFEGWNKYIKIVLKDGKNELIKRSMNSLLSLLPDEYIRIHKSFIISIYQIKEIILQKGNRFFIRLSSGKTLPIGRKVYKHLKETFLTF